ncbi:AAA family ATPase [Mariniphaga anaerophila]|uniref:AAA family ATPase n=1 Tax=Mariniphaga anaerophila TaxID=1484053 RepID=UPI00158765A8|nr:ATP-binding protein [Mariniphaga anaerophila]
MKTKPKTIVITGAESTGKSVLTERLANYFQVPFIPEFARNYIERLNRKYDYSDVEYIARHQVRELQENQNLSRPWIFADTWLIITKIWFEEVFEKCPKWLEAEIERTNIDLFLVCDTDLPWVADPVRENGGERRSYLQNRYIETIQKYGFDYQIVSGQNDARFENALQHLRQATGR